MKTIGYIIQKEFKQIFRNKGMLPIIFILPVMQLIILSNAATFEVKNINFSFIDHNKTSASRALIEKFETSTYFNVITEFSSSKAANSAMLKGDIDVILEIPMYFERDLLKDKKTNLSVTINAIDGAAAGIENVYITQIIQSFNRNIQTELFQPEDLKNTPINITTIPTF
ncbi:MAG TPA: ABC transporter permease, partial [Flavobacteriaceae bacterium]|nr:ABC transporter permease [Flavobacteriaceae bacterium]